MAARARQKGGRKTRREVEGPGELAGLAPGIATRLHRSGLTTRGQVAAWYGMAGPAQPLYGIGPQALVAIAVWLGVAEDAEDGTAR